MHILLHVTVVCSFITPFRCHYSIYSHLQCSWRLKNEPFHLFSHVSLCKMSMKIINKNDVI